MSSEKFQVDREYVDTKEFESSTSPSNGAPVGYHGKAIVHTSLSGPLTLAERDVFGNEEDAAIKYKTLSWQLCAVYEVLLKRLSLLMSTG